MSKVVPLNKLSPEVLLAQLAELDDIGSLVVVIHHDDGGYSANWSNQSNERLCASAVLLQQVAQEEMSDVE
jgi:hypothetical protein